MTERFARTELLLGAEAMRRLKDARVAVFGIGGVGGHAAGRSPGIYVGGRDSGQSVTANLPCGRQSGPPTGPDPLHRCRGLSAGEHGRG